MRILNSLIILVVTTFIQNSYCQTWPASNINVCGSFSTNELKDQHGGIDIYGEPVGTAGAMQCFAAYGGTITNIWDQVDALVIEIQVAPNIFLYYGHCEQDIALLQLYDPAHGYPHVPADFATAIGHVLASGDAFVRLATAANAYNGFPHVHFNYETAAPALGGDNLDPLAQTFAAGNEDPGGNAPEIGPLFVKQPDNGNHYIMDKSIYGNVKIIRDITDNMGHTEPNANYRIADNDAYPINSADNQRVNAAISNPHLVKFSVKNSAGNILFPIDNAGVAKEVQIHFDGNPKNNFSLLFDEAKESAPLNLRYYHCYDLTNITTANEISANHMYWNTRLKTGEQWNGASADIIYQAAFPDGKYLIHISAEDLGGHVTTKENEVVVDNFAPYVARLEVTTDKKIYESSWNWNAATSALDHTPNTLDAKITCGEKFQVVVTTNEPMSDVTISILNSSFSLTSITPRASSDSKIWELTVPMKALLETSEEEKDFVIILTGHDVNGSGLYGFPSGITSLPASDYPHRNTNGTWSTILHNGDMHVLHKGELKVTLLNTNSPKCYNDWNGQASVSIEGGTPTFFYEWNNIMHGSTDTRTITTTDLMAGTYTLHVRDVNSCLGSIAVNIDGPPKLNLSVSGGGIFRICDPNQKITLTASASGGTPPYTYNWPGGILEVGSSGIYTATVNDNNGCTASAWVIVGITRILCSIDPNEIEGPIGYGEQQFVSVNDELNYTVRFENDPEFASAPAQKVSIALPIDENLNINSLKLADFGFNNWIFRIPSNRNYYYTRLDLRDTLGIYVDVIAGIDVTNDRAFWTFQAIDPQTGISPADPKIGFLPVNNKDIHNREGYVSFNIKPNNKSQTGDSIRAIATIVFDKNESIPTNKWFNIIDAEAPASSIVLNPEQPGGSDLAIQWSGTDDEGGSGVNNYKLYYSENESLYQMYAGGITDTVIVFSTKPGASYNFFTRSLDNTGNEEELKSIPDASYMSGSITVLSPSSEDHYCTGDTVPIQWSAQGIHSVKIEVSADGGNSFIPIINNFCTFDSTYYWIIPIVLPASSGYIIKVSCAMNSFIYDLSEEFTIGGNTADAGEDASICFGDSIQLQASGGNAYEWNNPADLNNAFISNPLTHPLINTTYGVTVTDEYGCISEDIVTIEVKEVPVVSFTGLELTYCLRSDTIALTGTPVGGEFSGNGISGNSFIPILAGTGFHDITYTYYADNGCPGRQIQSVSVENRIPVNFTGLDEEYCIDDASVQLEGTPSGGLFRGDGINGIVFSPFMAAEGTHEITYTVVDKEGCSNIHEDTAIVYQLPEVSLGEDIAITTLDTITLVTQPEGFEQYLWSNSSADDHLTIFGSTIGVGAHMYSVIVKDDNTCSNSDSIEITVILPESIALENEENTVIYLYPNPARDIVNLRIENMVQSDLRVEVLDIRGTKVLSKLYGNTGAKNITDEIHISDLMPGSYVFEIICNDIVKHQMIVKGGR